jgi:hypothetical protein
MGSETNNFQKLNTLDEKFRIYVFNKVIFPPPKIMANAAALFLFFHSRL